MLCGRGLEESRGENEEANSEESEADRDEQRDSG